MAQIFSNLLVLPVWGQVMAYFRYGNCGRRKFGWIQSLDGFHPDIPKDEMYSVFLIACQQSTNIGISLHA